MSAYAFWVTGPSRGAVLQEQLEVPRDGEVKVRMLYSGISRGTESLVFRGEVPVSQHGSMRCPHQAGDFGFPVKYGYIAVGEVESEGALQGAPVFCLHPHQSHFVVPEADVVPLPRHLDPALAVLTANLETAVTGVWDAQIQPGERVTVIGAGVVGMLVAWRVQQAHALTVQLIDVNLGRGEVAARLGLHLTHSSQAVGESDVIIHASGSPDGLRSALSLAATEGRIIEMSWFGTQEVSLPLGEAFHSRRLTIRSSQVGAIPPAMRPAWTHRRRVEMVLELLADHPELGALISGESAFSALPDTMASLAGGASDVLCHRISYQE